MPAALAVLLVFLRLGVTSFGGPTAHLGYFRAELVERRRWVDDAGYLHLLGLCGLLPGPTSSQLGFALGWRRAGPLGALAAFVGFTLPSALLMAVAAGAPAAVPGGVVHELRLLAVAVVAGAVVAMARALPRQGWRYLTVGLGALVSGAAPAAVATSAAVGIGAVVGGWAGGRGRATPGTAQGGTLAASSGSGVVRPVVPPRLAVALGGVFLLGLGGAPWLAATGTPGRVLAALYTSGALVFGGGHVVLPLLHDALVSPGLVPEGEFLAGYGVAQAMPGPLFTFGTFLGMGTGGVAGAVLGTLALFAPGLLLVGPALAVGDALARHPRVARALEGAAAAVVGVLGVAAAELAWEEVAGSVVNLGMCLVYASLLGPGRRPPWQVVGFATLVGVVFPG